MLIMFAGFNLIGLLFVVFSSYKLKENQEARSRRNMLKSSLLKKIDII